MKRVGAVICNFNKKEDVLNCIQSVLESKYTDYDLYVVDNASSDGSAEAIREKYGSQVTVLVNAENLGGSGGFNTGLRKALEKGYEYLYCLDNDVLVDENAMGELVEFLDTHPDSGMAGSRVYHMENPGVIQQFGQIVDFKYYCTEAKFLGKTDADGIPDVEYSDAVAACSLMVRKSLIDEIGLMPEDNFLYWDDTEWGYCCNLAGYKVASVGSSVVLHRMGAKKLNELITLLQKNNPYLDYDIAYFQYGKNVEHGIYDAYDNVALLMHQKPSIKNCQILPPGKYLTAYHIGHWSTIGETYERIRNYKKEHNLRTSDLYIEYDVVNSFIEKNTDDFVTQIEVEIIQ